MDGGTRRYCSLRGGPSTMPFCGRKFNGSGYIGSRWSSHGRNNRFHPQYTHTTHTHTPPLLTVKGSYYNFFFFLLISSLCFAGCFHGHPWFTLWSNRLTNLLSMSKHLNGVHTWESVAICLCVWVCDMRVGAGCSWVVQLWAEWLSEMTVINSFILEPVDCTINHVY